MRVLRAEAGQRYEISDNRDVYLAEITSARKAAVCFEVIEKLPAQAEAAPAVLVIALIKFDRFEWLVEKATELGVAEIRLFRSDANGARLAAGGSEAHGSDGRRIAFEASQQARRAHLPELIPVSSAAEAFATDARNKVMLDEDPGAPPIRKAGGGDGYIGRSRRRLDGRGTRDRRRRRAGRRAR